MLFCSVFQMVRPQTIQSWHPICFSAVASSHGIQSRLWRQAPSSNFCLETKPSTSYSTIVQTFGYRLCFFYRFRPFGLFLWSQHQTCTFLGCFCVNQGPHKVRSCSTFHVCPCLPYVFVYNKIFCLIYLRWSNVYSDWGEHVYRQPSWLTSPVFLF